MKMAFRNLRNKALAAGYRSGLEEDIGIQLKQFGVDAEYEPFAIPYTQPETHRKYTPDYVLPNGIVIETKGRFTTEDRKKHIWLKDQYGPDLDIRFVFSNANGKLRKGAKTTYAEWCVKNGFMYAGSEIPEAWILEKINKKALALLQKLRG